MTPEQHLAKLTVAAHDALEAERAQFIGASWLRKRFRIDYTTAVHLMDRLESNGDIAPATDAPLRLVLMPAAGFSIFD
jgi:DNA segregation ATPase FtsK/SpoIIIE-like protein